MKFQRVVYSSGIIKLRDLIAIFCCNAAIDRHRKIDREINVGIILGVKPGMIVNAQWDLKKPLKGSQEAKQFAGMPGSCVLVPVWGSVAEF
jgi:hypothetical protein